MSIRSYNSLARVDLTISLALALARAHALAHARALALTQALKSFGTQYFFNIRVFSIPKSALKTEVRKETFVQKKPIFIWKSYRLSEIPAIEITVD